MPFHDLTPDDRALIGRCLRAVVDGPFFKNNPAFHCIFGLDPEEVRDIALRWPDVDVANTSVHVAVANSLNNLLGYPHKTPQADWDEWIGAKSEDLVETLDRWLEDNLTSYFDATK